MLERVNHYIKVENATFLNRYNNRFIKKKQKGKKMKIIVAMNPKKS